MNPFVLTHANLFLSTLLKYSITTPLRLAHFLAQIHHESGGFTRFSENLNYTPAGLLDTFGGRITRQQANQYGRHNGYIAQQPNIANTVYGGAWGIVNLGNTQKGDGYKFRGRGLIQLTGRANYEAYKKYSGLDVVSNPDLVATLSVGLDVAGWFWLKNNINTLSDRNDIEGITKKINGGQKGLEKRKQYFQLYLSQNISLAYLKKKETP